MFVTAPEWREDDVHDDTAVQGIETVGYGAFPHSEESQPCSVVLRLAVIGPVAVHQLTASRPSSVNHPNFRPPAHAAFLALAAAYACFICCIRTRIMLALGITKEAARAMGFMPIIVLVPLIQVSGSRAWDQVARGRVAQ